MDILASAAMDAQRRGFERLCLICLHGFNGATCPRCPLTSGPPAPDPREIDNAFREDGTPLRRFWLCRLKDETGISRTGRVLEGVVTQSGRVLVEWRPPHATLGIYKDLEEFRIIHVDCHPSCNEIVWLDEAAVPVPPAGLTVARLAALLAASPLRVPLDGWEWDEPTPDAATWPEHLAAWLLPRLGSVSPGAPAVVRRAPTDAMIEAAAQVIGDALDAVDSRGAPYFAVARTVAANALRAALAAQDRT